MKTAVKTHLKTRIFCMNKSYTRLKEKETCIDDFKFYQKLFVLLISFSTILILPESPRELGKICEDYHSKKICNVW